MVCWVQRGQESKRSFLGKGDHPCKSVGEQQSAVRGQCCSSLPPHPISILPSVLTTMDTEQGGNRLSQRSRSPSLPCGYKWPVKWFQITRPSGALLGVLQQDGSLVIEGSGSPFPPYCFPLCLESAREAKVGQPSRDQEAFRRVTQENRKAPRSPITSMEPLNQPCFHIPQTVVL